MKEMAVQEDSKPFVAQYNSSVEEMVEREEDNYTQVEDNYIGNAVLATIMLAINEFINAVTQPHLTRSYDPCF